MEDDDRLRVWVQRALEERGYRVFTAANEPQALALLAALRSPIDLLLADVVMPKMKGPNSPRAPSYKIRLRKCCS